MDEKRYGVAYVSVALYLELDLTEQEIQELVAEMVYDMKHRDIQHTQIKEVSTEYLN